MTIVILGAGQAAASVAAKLRGLGHDGPITIVGDEPIAPYQRPPLSKAYLLGEMGVDRLTLRAAEWWAEQKITLQLGEHATVIDRERCRVTTDRDEIAYDTLVLTLGASPRRLPIAIGGTLPGVHIIRNLAQIDRLAQELTPGHRLVVIGGGYIGLEAAAVARKLGLAVTVVEIAPRILGRVTAPQTADLIRALHLAHGVEIIEGVGVRQITGHSRAEGVELEDGRILPASLVICGIGAMPETVLAETAGLRIDNGIATDRYGRTSDARIWAAGDCASFPGQTGQLRLESVGNAIDMAEAVAANILGADRPYIPKPWFWSDQFDSKLQICGLQNGYDQIVQRTTGEHSGSIWYFHQGRLIAVDALNDARAYMIGKRLIDAGRSPTPQAVKEAADLRELMA